MDALRAGFSSLRKQINTTHDRLIGISARSPCFFFIKKFLKIIFILFKEDNSPPRKYGRRGYRSNCRCAKISNCPKIQITIPRCPAEEFVCCFNWFCSPTFIYNLVNLDNWIFIFLVGIAAIFLPWSYSLIFLCKTFFEEFFFGTVGQISRKCYQTDRSEG